MAYNQFEYYTRIEEKTAEIANWDLDQEENIKSVGLQMIKFGQKMEVYDPFIWKRGLFNESEEPIGFGPNIQCPGIVNDTIRKSRLMDLKQRRNAKKVRKESKNVVNVTVTEDHEYNIEDVLQNLEVSEASSKKSKRKKKKSAQDDRNRTVPKNMKIKIRIRIRTLFVKKKNQS